MWPTEGSLPCAARGEQGTDNADDHLGTTTFTPHTHRRVCGVSTQERLFAVWGVVAVTAAAPSTALHSSRPLGGRAETYLNVSNNLRLIQKEADPKLRVCTSAERVFLLSAASLSPIGSYAQLVVCGKESLSPGVTMLSMKLA